MMRIRQRISGLALVLLAAGSGAFTTYDANAVPAPDGDAAIPAFMAAPPVFANAGSLAGDFASGRPAIRVSSFGVNIFGQDTIPPNDICYWESNPTGGTPPYTYQWYGGSSSTRNQPDFWGSASSSFWLEVKVTDANNVVGWGDLFVTVSSWSGACII